MHLLKTGTAGVPVVSDLGLAVAPTGTLDNVPERVDVLLVPGGSRGTAEAMRDERLLAWLSRTGERAGLVCGVCTGSVVLGRAEIDRATIANRECR